MFSARPSARPQWPVEVLYSQLVHSFICSSITKLVNNILKANEQILMQIATNGLQGSG